MPRVRSFPPLMGPQPRALVLGSMPGLASLRAGRYYAHPRNAFWPLMAALFDLPADGGYPARAAALAARGVAVWDVLAECEREGSLDSAIVPASARVNDLPALLLAQPTLGVVALNGGAAARLFRRHVAPALAARLAAAGRDAPLVLALPSTSPAHAARSFEAKLAAWRALAAALDAAGDRACA